jgi:hypothetical protein
MRRILVLLALCAALAGCASTYPPTPAGPAAPPPSAVAPASPTLLTVPNEIGKNAAVALDDLHKLGFTNVDLGTVDGHEFVVLPQNWTVRTQSAPAGSQLAGDAKIVLGCARNG